MLSGDVDDDGPRRWAGLCGATQRGAPSKQVTRDLTAWDICIEPPRNLSVTCLPNTTPTSANTRSRSTRILGPAASPIGCPSRPDVRLNLCPAAQHQHRRHANSREQLRHAWLLKPQRDREPSKLARLPESIGGATAGEGLRRGPPGAATIPTGLYSQDPEAAASTESPWGAKSSANRAAFAAIKGSTSSPPPHGRFRRPPRPGPRGSQAFHMEHLLISCAKN